MTETPNSPTPEPAKPKKVYTKKAKALSAQAELVARLMPMAIAAGCPKDQFENFLKAGVFLQPKQFEFAALARQCDLPNGPKDIMLGGGRGSSKSHGILAQIFCDDCQRVPGLKVLILRKVGRANREQIQDFRKKLLSALPHNYREQQSTITFDNGSLVVLGNFKDERDIDKYLGLEYDLEYIMESNQITLTKKMNILSCLRTNKPNWRPRCYEDTNPGGVGHFHNKQIFIEPWKAGRETETRYIHCTVDDNKFVNPEYKEYLEKLSGWQREAWLYGSWEFLAGAYFTTFRDDIHVYPNANVNLVTKNIKRYFGAFDYGFSHRSAFLLFAQDHEENIYVVGEYTDEEKTPSDHAERIKALLRSHGLENSDLDSIVAGHDCFHKKEEGNTIAQTYAENGLDFIPAENARVNGWQRMLDGFGDSNTNTKPTLFVHKSCVHLIAQIKMAQHSEKIPGDVQKFDFVSKGVEIIGEDMSEGDDCLDACRYGVFSNTSNALKFAVPMNITGFQPAMIELPSV
ncbi:MAG: phage terminase large subunit [Patescibacteria group bacterium]|nr:phage terminase large subunit [Patescibacteria group bacterium]